LPLQWTLPSALHLHALLWTTAALAPRQAASPEPWIDLAKQVSQLKTCVL
jgi:hypothetical protein